MLTFRISTSRSWGQRRARCRSSRKSPRWPSRSRSWQRTPNWIMPRGRVTYSDSKRKLFNLVPPYLRITQKVQRALMGMIEQASTLGHKRMDQFENRVLGFIKKAIDDPKTQEAVNAEESLRV